MPKRVLYVCAHCRGYIYVGETSRVLSTKDGVLHFHYDHGLDCLADRDRERDLDQREFDFDDHVAVRGTE